MSLSCIKRVSKLGGLIILFSTLDLHEFSVSVRSRTFRTALSRFVKSVRSNHNNHAYRRLAWSLLESVDGATGGSSVAANESPEREEKIDRSLFEVSPFSLQPELTLQIYV